MPRTPLRDLRPELFQNEYQTESDDSDSDGGYFQSNNMVKYYQIEGKMKECY